MVWTLCNNCIAQREMYNAILEMTSRTKGLSEEIEMAVGKVREARDGRTRVRANNGHEQERGGPSGMEMEQNDGKEDTESEKTKTVI